MKRTLALTLVMALLVCVMPTIGLAESTWYNGMDFSEHVSVEYMGWSNQGLDGSDPIFQKIEELFNMDLTYTSVPNGEYQNFSSARLASGDIPTMFKFMVPDTGGLNLYRQFKDDGMIVNISEYIEKYQLNNLKMLLEEDWAQSLKEDDGFYQVPNKIGPSMQAIYVRQDWADELGLEAPKTYEEYKEYLRAMVGADLDGNSTTGLTIVGVDAMDYIISAFTGKSGTYVNVDGEWVHKSQAPGFTDGLKYFRDLYSEGLLDPEFAMMSNTTIQEKLSSGRAASLILNGTAAWWNPMETALLAYNPDAKLGALSAWPAGPAGEIRNGGANFYGTVVISSAASEAQIARALAFMDWTLSDECYDLFYYGIEGVTYEVVDGKRVINEAAKQELTKGKDLYQFYDLINNVSQYKALTIQPLYDNYLWLKDHVVFDEVIGLSTDVTIEVGTAIDDVYRTWMVDFVTGEKDIDADWDAYLAEMETAGLSRYIAEIEAYKAQ